MSGIIRLPAQANYMINSAILNEQVLPKVSWLEGMTVNLVCRFLDAALKLSTAINVKPS